MKPTFALPKGVRRTLIRPHRHATLREGGRTCPAPLGPAAVIFLMLLLLLMSTVLGAWAAEPDVLLEETRHRLRTGDFRGALIVAEEALDIQGSHTRKASYLRGLALEFDRQLEEALRVYESLLDEWPEDEAADDVIFRRAETLGALGRYSEAARGLRSLGPPEEYGLASEVKIRVLQATWDIQRGRERRGLSILGSLLKDAHPEHAPRYQARGHAAIAGYAAAAARELEFRGNDRRKARILHERARLVSLGKDQLQGNMDSGAHKQVLLTILHVGRLHADLAVAMTEERRLHQLNEAQRAIYDHEVRERAAALQLMAARYFTRGVQYAEATGWQGPPLPELRRRKDSSTSAVESLDKPGH